MQALGRPTRVQLSVKRDNQDALDWQMNMLPICMLVDLKFSFGRSERRILLVICSWGFADEYSNWQQAATPGQADYRQDAYIPVGQ